MGCWMMVMMMTRWEVVTACAVGGSASMMPQLGGAETLQQVSHPDKETIVCEHGMPQDGKHGLSGNEFESGYIYKPHINSRM